MFLYCLTIETEEKSLNILLKLWRKQKLNFYWVILKSLHKSQQILSKDPFPDFEL